MNIERQGPSMQSDGDINTDFGAELAQPGSETADMHVAANRSAPRTRQPWGRLLKAVLDLAGDRAELIRHVERDWTSATFAGSRHTIVLRFSGADAAEVGEHFIATLPDHQFTIPRYLIADAQIIAVDDNRLPERALVVEAQLLLLDQA